MTAHLGWLNYVMSGALDAGSAETALPIENLQEPIGSASAAWQTATGVLTPAGGAWFTVTPTVGAQTWRAAGIFRTNLSSSASVTFYLYNSPSSLVWSKTVSGPAAGYGQVIAVADADQVADYLRVEITDTSNLDNFINVPLAFGGPTWAMTSPPAYDTLTGREDRTDSVVSIGGQEFPVPRWNRRRWDISMQNIRATEIWSDAMEADRVSRSGGNVLFVPDSGSSALNKEATFGRLQSLADVGFPYGASDRRSWRARITERI